MPRVTLTEFSLRSLKGVPGKHVIYLDKNGPTGFGVRVTEGSRSYVVTYGKERKRVTLGSVGSLSLREAREKAREVLTGKHQATTPTVESAVRQFVSLHCAQRNRPSTARETERLLTRHLLPVGEKSVSELTKADLNAVFDGLLGTPSEANHAFTATKTFLNWCLGRGYVEKHPLQALRKPARAPSRSRVLSDTELRSVWLYGASGGPYGQLIQLLILTGQRLGQLSHLTAEMIEEDKIVWPAHFMKSGEEHTIPVCPLARTIMEERPRAGLLFSTESNPREPFNNWSNSHRRLLEVTRVDHFTRHDLRRTFSTVLARHTPPHVIERLIAHRSGVISGVSAIYNRHLYFDEMKDSLLRHEAYVASLVSSQG